MNREISSHDKKLAFEAVNRFSPGDLLGKGVKLTEDGEYQIRVRDDLRVRFIINEGEKEITDVFAKGNHISR